MDSVTQIQMPEVRKMETMFLFARPLITVETKSNLNEKLG